MGQFAEWLSKESISTDSIVRKSSQLESRGGKGRQLSQKRWQKRQTAKEKAYTELHLAKPPLGRGVSHRQVQTALRDLPVSLRVRSKIRKAVNAILAKKGQADVDAITLFGAVAVRSIAKLSPSS